MRSSLQIDLLAYYYIDMKNMKVSKKSADAKKVISLMVKNELAFARLYHKYAVVFDDDFWRDLELQERRHPQWLEALSRSRDVISLSTNFVSSAAIEQMVRVVEADISSQEPNDLSEALNRSLKFEKSFIENNYFEIFILDAPTIRRVVEDLRDETLEHIKTIEEKIKALG